MSWIRQVPEAHECRLEGSLFWPGIGSLWRCPICDDVWKVCPAAHGGKCMRRLGSFGQWWHRVRLPKNVVAGRGPAPTVPPPQVDPNLIGRTL